MKRINYSVSGIYGIINKINGKIYVGSAFKILRRLQIHKDSLYRGKDSPRLQLDWDKYGEHHFEFTVLEIVKDISKLYDREQW